MVQYAWLIPALPLAALIIVLLVTRPLDVAARPRVPRPAPPADDAHGAADAHEAHEAHDVATTNGHAHEAHTADDSGHGGGHDEHGGATPFWARVGSAITTVTMLAAFVIAVIILIQFLTNSIPASFSVPWATKDLTGGGVTLHLYDWFNFGPLHYQIQFRIDTLTAIMLVVVTGVSMLVHLYSIGYMAGDPGYSRFFIELSFFTVSMLILVLGANFLVLFIGWELVGLSSYLLIGFGSTPRLPATPPTPTPRPIRRPPRSRRSSRRAWATSAS